jgi:hypothetical protein
MFITENYLDKTSCYIKPDSCNWFPLGNVMGQFPLNFNSNSLPEKINAKSESLE